MENYGVTNKDTWDFDYNELLFKANPLEQIETERLTKNFKDKISYFSDNKNLNVEISLAKKYNLYSPSSLEFTLTSISLHFKNLTEIGQNINVVIPLALIPVFYYAMYNFEIFKKLMCCLLRFNNDYTELEFMMEELDLVMQANKKIFNQTLDISMLKTIHKRYTFDWYTEKSSFEVIVR